MAADRACCPTWEWLASSEIPPARKDHKALKKAGTMTTVLEK